MTESACGGAEPLTWLLVRAIGRSAQDALHHAIENEEDDDRKHYPADLT
jgi:hypothetical protein